MAETAPLPLQQAPASAVATASPPANTPTSAAGHAGVLHADANGADAPMASASPFEVLLGDLPDSAAALDAALPGLARVAADGRPEDQAAAVDPLQVILAQMPNPAAMVPLQPASVPVQAGGVPTASVSAAGGMPNSTPVTGLSLASPDGLQMPALAPDVGSDAASGAASDGTGVPALAAPLQAVPQAADARASIAAQDGLTAFLRSASLSVEAPVSASPLAAGPLASPLAWPDADMASAARVGGEAPTGVAVNSPMHALQALGAVQAQAAVASQPGQIPVPVLHQPTDPTRGYDEPFGSHVAWLAGQRIGQAEIRVVPEHLGAIDIRLQLDGNNVRAEFHSSQPEVRQALEASLPRLRDMLGQQGLQLSHAGVGQGQGGQQRQSGDGAPRRGEGQPDGLALPQEAGSPLPPDFRRGRGLVDVYA